MINNLPLKVTTQRGSKFICPRLQAGRRQSTTRVPPRTRSRPSRGTMAEDITTVAQAQDSGSWINCNWLKWCPTSEALLEAAEAKILSYLKRPYRVEYVNIGSGYGWKEDTKVRSLSTNTECATGELPLVLLHGFASGVGLWILNLDSLSADRPVYAMDLLGFGRSSRPSFSSSAMEAEYQLVQSIEAWREKMNVDRFVLLGHSMGGFLAASYALQYPHRVAHLVLADPWGFPEKPASPSHQYTMPVWVKVFTTVLQPFNPLAGLRAAGPWGPRLVERFRPDLQRKFSTVVDDSEVIPNYIYHCNAQIPSGEIAFKSMTAHLGWAKHPMVNRMAELREDVPISFIYGSRSWIDRQPGIQTKYTRVNSYVDVQIISASGHHVYADKPEQFNSLVRRICERADLEELQRRDTVEEGPRIVIPRKDDSSVPLPTPTETPVIETPVL